jgi:hypothetical protein
VTHENPDVKRQALGAPAEAKSEESPSQWISQLLIFFNTSRRNGGEST